MAWGAREGGGDGEAVGGEVRLRGEMRADVCEQNAYKSSQLLLKLRLK